MKLYSASRFFKILMLPFVIISLIKCSNSPSDEEANKFKGNWNFAVYRIHGDDLLSVRSSDETYYNYSCSQSLNYQYLTKTNWVMKFSDSGHYTQTREDIITIVDTAATEKDCSIHYQSTRQNKTFYGKWSLSQDKKTLLLMMQTESGISIDFGPPMTPYNYAIMSLGEYEIKLKETGEGSENSEITLARK